MAKQPSRRVVDIRTRKEHIGDDPATPVNRGLSVDDISELKSALASQSTDIKHILHDIRNIAAQQQAQMSRGELESRLNALDARITKMEAAQTWVVRAIVTAWLAGIGVVGVFFKSG